MNQLSLNLVAIAVFAMTFSSLLGPLVHLSPVVPAIATAGVLGLAALDNFSWQGQGGSLLLDWLAGFDATHRSRVVQHEAGHFLVAHLLGIPVTGYTLSAWQAFRQGYPGQAGVRFDMQELDTELQQGALSGQLLNRYCTIWMAGGAAEFLIYGTVQGGADDRQKIDQVLTQLGLSPSDRQQKARWAVLQAKTLLKENDTTYQALVEAMAQGASVEECNQVIAENQ